ncbi:MAG: iron ABC transporter permease [Vallitalea sp.]|jgi:iron complex transport system permease protein|nr:iron ABC transporter permease [Vallitalea sp.]
METEKSHSKKFITLLILLVIAFIVLIGSIVLGSVNIPITNVFKAVFTKENTVDHQIIWNIRLPRVLIGALVGICLSLAGVILQGIMRNPLASPNIIGVTSGAGLAAYVILILFPNYYYLVPAGAFGGAFLATLFIYCLAWKDGVQPMRLVLAGVAFSSLLGAGINTLMTFFPDRVAGAVSFMVGSLSGRTWPHFNLLWPYALAGCVCIIFFAQKINILLLGDEIATGLGLKVERIRLILIMLASLLAASAVSTVGLLGFVGLIVPHTARMIIGSDYRYLFPTTAILGAITVMACDTLARIAFDPIELPVGIVMAFLGAPFFLYLLRERKKSI